MGKANTRTPRVLVIAEAGVNHNGELALAHRLVDTAVEAGADAVKFQTFRADRVVCRGAPMAAYQRTRAATVESQLEMLGKLELDPASHQGLVAHCRRRGIMFLSTAFDRESVDLLDALDVSAFKIASGEITNLPLLEYIARKNKPILLSTGMSSLGEVESAVEVLRAAGAKEITLLHCTSAYPADPADANLRAMVNMGRAFGLPVGYSDHTLGVAVAMAAVALGAQVIEKHFTLDRSLPGPDHAASLDPQELRDLVAGIRAVECAMGDGIKRPTAGEADTQAVARRSVVTARAMRAGTVLTCDDLTLKRPGTGFPPGSLGDLIGRSLACDVAADELITPGMLR
jgi:N-acetylneuraminate synthase/N,N'-diacetyllegionaminate synthase